MSILRGRTRLIVATGCACAAVAAAAIGAGASPRDDLQAARAATAKYHSLQQARRDGYVPASPCVASPAGAMGVHFENRELMDDPQLEVDRPEILLYLPKENGKLELVGVEYYVEADEAPSHPRLFGRGFDGPMPAHHPGMETHYDLHVWLWEENPAGRFSQFNPRLSCPN